MYTCVNAFVLDLFVGSCKLFAAVLASVRQSNIVFGSFRLDLQFRIGICVKICIKTLWLDETADHSRRLFSGHMHVEKALISKRDIARAASKRFVSIMGLLVDVFKLEIIAEK